MSNACFGREVEWNVSGTMIFLRFSLFQCDTLQPVRYAPRELVAKWWRALLTSATDVARRRAIGATMTTQNADLNSMGWRG
jgi:hypothetical protein